MKEGNHETLLAFGRCVGLAKDARAELAAGNVEKAAAALDRLVMLAEEALSDVLDFRIANPDVGALEP